jgi:hypothetical protein
MIMIMNDLVKPSQTPSNRIKPNQTKSNQIKPVRRKYLWHMELHGSGIVKPGQPWSNHAWPLARPLFAMSDFMSDFIDRPDPLA